MVVPAGYKWKGILFEALYSNCLEQWKFFIYVKFIFVPIGYCFLTGPRMNFRGEGKEWLMQGLPVPSMLLFSQSCVRLLWPPGLQPARLLCPWDFPGKNTGVVAISFSRGSYRPRDWTHVSCIGGRFFTAEPLRDDIVNGEGQTRMGSITDLLDAPFPLSLVPSPFCQVENIP